MRIPQQRAFHRNIVRTSRNDSTMILHQDTSRRQAHSKKSHLESSHFRLRSYPQHPRPSTLSIHPRCIESDACASYDPASRQKQADRVIPCIESNARMHRVGCMQIEDNEYLIMNEPSRRSQRKDPPSEASMQSYYDRASCTCIESTLGAVQYVLRVLCCALGRCLTRPE